LLVLNGARRTVAEDDPGGSLFVELVRERGELVGVLRDENDRLRAATRRAAVADALGPATCHRQLPEVLLEADLGRPDHRYGGRDRQQDPPQGARPRWWARGRSRRCLRLHPLPGKEGLEGRHDE